MELREVVTIKTSRFDTSLREEHINECCRGGEYAQWLLGRLREGSATPFNDLYQEDFGWVIDAPVDNSSDVVMLTIVFFPPDEDCAQEVLCVGADIRSSFMTNLLKKDRKQKLAELKDELILRIDQLVQAEQDFENIQWWHDGPMCGEPASHPNE